MCHVTPFNKRVRCDYSEIEAIKYVSFHLKNINIKVDFISTYKGPLTYITGSSR